MALYHFTMNQVTRSHGQSVVNCAAYRAGEKLWDEYYGESRDYSRKGGVVYKEIFLPPNAPERYSDRATLWTEVEFAEKNKKAQLAHSFEFALQTELSLEENIALARKFVQENFVSRGMIADICVHDPLPKSENDPPNPHVHVLCPIRPLDENGGWGIKQKKIPVTDKEGNPVLTKSGKPKMRAVPTTDWSSRETLEEYRRNWAETVNAAFAEKGLSCRIDHRSYDEQGNGLIPTIHEGSAVCKMEAKGIRTEKRQLNILIKTVNKMLTRILEMVRWGREVRDELKEEMERKRNPTILEYLRDYYDRRNAVAQTYQYGTHKAELHNLKEFAETLVLIEQLDIQTPEDLEAYTKEIQSEMKPIKERLAKRSAEITKLQNLIRRRDEYAEFKPVYDEYSRKIFGKKDFEKAHHNELVRFQIAKREIDANRTEDGKIPINRWRSQLKELLELKKKDTEELDDCKGALADLNKIRRCIGMALNQEQPSGEDAVRSEEKAVSNGEKQSIHERMGKYKQVQREQERSPQNHGKKKKNRGMEI